MKDMSSLFDGFMCLLLLVLLALIILRPILIAALMLLIPLISLINIIVDKREEKRIEEESRKEYLEYTKIRNDLAGRFGEVLSNGGHIKPYPKKPGTFIGCLPDGQIRIIDLGGLTDIWAGSRAPVSMGPDDDPESFLASPDLMILRTGRYKVTAAGRIIKRTKEACGALGGIPCLYISGDRRTVAGVDSAGIVASVTFDLPVDRLFKGLDDMDKYRADRLGPLEKNIVSVGCLAPMEKG